jgi:uncharacterized protein YkwD
VSIGSDSAPYLAVRLRLHVLLPLCALLLLAGSGSAQAACRGAQATPRTLSGARGATLCLVNIQRRAHGLPALRSDPRLRSAATAYSRAMVRRRFFDHIGPDGSTLQQRLEQAGYATWVRIGENIAWGSGRMSTPASIVNGWMRSPGHRANILDAEYREIGIGVARGAPAAGVRPGRAVVYTTDFGRTG